MNKRLFSLFVVSVIWAWTLVGASSATGAVGPQCGDVLTSSATLTANLNCSGNGLTLAPTADMTLDLRGLSVLGSGTGVGIAVNPASAKVTVKNGTIRGFGIGVQIDGVGSARLERLTVRNNAVGVSGGTNGGPATTLANSVITNNRGDGVSIAFIRPFEMTNDRVTENGGNGIFAFEDSLTALRNSFIARNHFDGVDIFNSFSVISGNTFFANGGTGLSLGDTLLCLSFPQPPYTVANNLATENGNGGMIEMAVSTPGCDPVPPAGTGNHAHGNAVFQCIVIVCETP
jgi:hypothetical protein